MVCRIKEYESNKSDSRILGHALHGLYTSHSYHRSPYGSAYLLLTLRSLNSVCIHKQREEDYSEVSSRPRDRNKEISEGKAYTFLLAGYRDDTNALVSSLPNYQIARLRLKNNLTVHNAQLDFSLVMASEALCSTLMPSQQRIKPMIHRICLGCNALVSAQPSEETKTIFSVCPGQCTSLWLEWLYLEETKKGFKRYYESRKAGRQSTLPIKEGDVLVMKSVR